MEPKIPYWHSSRFLAAFIYKKGEDGCVVCAEEQTRVSMDRAPPPLRDQIKSESPKDDPENTAKERSDPWKNLFVATAKAVGAVRSLNEWAATPLPPPAPAISQSDSGVAAESKRKKYQFDIQDIPGVIKTLGAPKGAAMLAKWFAGESSYSPTREDAKAGLNQKCKPISASMIDKKTVSMKWVLSYERAEQAYEQLLHKKLEKPEALDEIKKCLAPFKHKPRINGFEQCCGDIVRLHRDFQFQSASVESGLAQKLEQYLTRVVSDRGIPDDLTFTLGAFNIYAAIGDATFRKISGGAVATVNTLYFYVKDSFDFNDPENMASQYLGHWNGGGVALVPRTAVNVSAWSDSPILRNMLSKYENPMFPVRNVDFQNWRIRHHQGGDIMIYTDALCRRADKPIAVTIPD